MSTTRSNINKSPFSADNYLNRCKRFKLDPISTKFASPSRLNDIKKYIFEIRWKGMVHTASPQFLTYNYGDY